MVAARLLWHVRGPSGDETPPRAGVPRVMHRSGISPPSPSGQSIGSASSHVRRFLPAIAPRPENGISGVTIPPRPNAERVRPALGKPCAAPARDWGSFPAHIRTGLDRNLVARLAAWWRTALMDFALPDGIRRWLVKWSSAALLAQTA